MAGDETTEAHKGHTPPYIAFQSLKTMLGAFKAGGLPGRLDRSVLTNFSGAVGGQIITSLRFLRLINEDGRPLPEFEKLIDAFGTDRWPSALADLIRDAYRPIFDLNLETASPMQFNERFRATFPSKEETLRKCITFFLNAARDAQIPVSPYIMKNKKPRSAPAKKRAAKPNEEKPRQDAPPKPNGVSQHDTPAFADRLLGKFPEFDPQWPDSIKEQWFQGFQRLMGMADPRASKDNGEPQE